MAPDALCQLDLVRYHRLLDGMNLSRLHGSVVKVRGLVIEAQGPSVGVGELCRITTSRRASALAEVVGFQGEHRLLIPMESVLGIAPGDAVAPCTWPPFPALGRQILGRVLDGLGRPIDGKGPLRSDPTAAIDVAAPHPLKRKRIIEPFQTGIRAIDGLVTCGKGQRMGIFSGSGVGKSVLLGEIAKASEADVNVLALVGERGREVREFLDECLGDSGLARSAVVVATSDTSPVQRVRAVFVATTIAEYFREQGLNVVFMMDSVTRFAHAQRQIGLSAGEPPTTKGYPPSVFHLLPRITERLGCSDRGSITGILTVLSEGDDMNDPVADAVRSLLDGHIALSRALSDQGHYPAIDILPSVSRLMNRVTDPAHQEAARMFKGLYATYREAEDLINIGAYAPGSNLRIDRAIALIEPMRAFLRQEVGERSTLAQTRSALLSLLSKSQTQEASPGPGVTRAVLGN